MTTQRYHNNGRLIMLEVKCIKFSLEIQNSLGIIMCKFHAFQSKTEGMAASVRVFLEHPSYFTDRSMAVLLLWIFNVFFLSCVCNAFVRVNLNMSCGHLLGKG